MKCNFGEKKVEKDPISEFFIHVLIIIGHNFFFLYLLRYYVFPILSTSRYPNAFLMLLMKLSNVNN